MSKMKQEKILGNPKILAGPEIETLADYLGQGALGVQFYNPSTELIKFHPISGAYNDIIAQAVDKKNKLCMSTDSNRSQEKLLFPRRTSIEFRSNPEQENTKELLHLTKAYSAWLTQQKAYLLTSAFKNYKKATRHERNVLHYLNLSDFIKYYNGLKSTQVALEITSPHQIFDPRNSGPDFEFHFPYDARWVLQLSYEDLTPKLPPVFTTQYNLSLPLGFIFDPQVKNAFPMVKEFSLLDKEKEIAADFNESRPHHLLRDYEQKVFNSAVALADNFFAVKNFPPSASGARDLLRGMAYEIALISTSQTYLLELFREDAFWIATQRNKADLAKGGKEKLPSDKELEEIAVELSNTLRKSLFPYFLKATLADLFKQLHPYEQQLLKSLPKNAIKSFCLHATKIANGGVGNTRDHHAHLLSTHDTFMEMFDVFYDQTFNQVAVGADFAPTDPIGCLTDRFISPVDLGSPEKPLKALVVELRVPAQGKQQFEDIEKMCKSFGATHQQILKESYSKKVQSDLDLNALAQSKISKRKKPAPDTEQPDTLIKPSAVKAKKFAEPTKVCSPLATQSMFHHKRITRATEASKTRQDSSSTRRANEIDKDTLTSSSNKRMKH